MWKFLKRQWACKTGKGAITAIVGTVAAVATGALAPAAAVTPIIMSGLAMFLRDTEAKKEQDDGE